MSDIKSILVTGSQGQLGRSIEKIASQESGYQWFFASREQLDLNDNDAIDSFFHQHRFDLIIHCAAYTAVDKAESEPDLVGQINYLAVKRLAEIASRQQTKLIHISTDYVFNGRQYRPYKETDATDPNSVYGLTKLKGEEALLQAMPHNAVIIRTSWVYSEFGNNFVKTMLRLGQQRESLGVIFDQVGTPTYAHDLAQTIVDIVNNQRFRQKDFPSEIYHYSNEGVCSWYDFAKTIFDDSGIQCSIQPIETKDYPTPAKRPFYSVLNKVKIKQQFNVSIPYWKDSLQQCLQILKEQTA